MNSSAKQPQKYLFWIDNLRVLACLLIILSHSAMPSIGNDGIFKFLISFFSSFSSELFLTISGAVLLPIKLTMKEFYLKRFIKLLPPLLFWSSVIILVKFFQGDLSLYELVKNFLSLPFYPAHGVYWFVYVIAGLYLFAPLISKWLDNASQKEVELYLGLWLITLVLPYGNLVSSDFFTQQGNHYLTLNYFGGFLGYWILGFYLRKYPLKFKRDNRLSLVFITAAIYVFTIFYLKVFTEIDTGQYTDNLQIGSAAFVALVITVAQNITNKNTKVQGIVKNVAKYTFGIYLVHIIVIRDFVWLLFENNRMHVLIESPLLVIVSFGFSVLLLWVLTLSDKTRWTTGVDNDRIINPSGHLK